MPDPNYFSLACREAARAKAFQDKHCDILAAISYKNFQIALARWRLSLPIEPEHKSALPC